jgi:hypothetical protein
MRRVLIAAAALTAACAPTPRANDGAGRWMIVADHASAQSGAPGVWRIDTTTGAMSFCGFAGTKDVRCITAPAPNPNDPLGIR